MLSPISIKKKKRFLAWFLSEYELKRQDIVWMLDYLIEHEHLLINVHFVTDVSNYPKGMIITSRCSNEISFRFHKQHIVTDDVDRSFHDIRLHPDERMYVQLNFWDAKTNSRYLNMLEDRYFSHENKQVKRDDQELAEQLLDKVIDEFNRKQLRNKINKALDHNDKRSFLRLSNEWNKIANEKSLSKRNET